MPTYIIAEQDLIQQDLSHYGKILSPGLVSDELPLDLPSCFKNANPYTDCKFRFGRVTGQWLSPAITDDYAKLGAAFDKSAKALIGDVNKGDQFWGQQLGDLVAEYRKPRSYNFSYDLHDTVDDNLLRHSSASIWASSPSFPRGYGYGLDADGAAAPSVSPEAVRSAMDGLRSQINVEEIRRRLDSGTQ